MIKRGLNILMIKADTKFAKDFVQMAAAGIFCGGLIHFAVRAKTQVTTILAVMIFILISIHLI